MPLHFNLIPRTDVHNNSHEKNRVFALLPAGKKSYKKQQHAFPASKNVPTFEPPWKSGAEPLGTNLFSSGPWCVVRCAKYDALGVKYDALGVKYDAQGANYDALRVEVRRLEGWRTTSWGEARRSILLGTISMPLGTVL